MTELICNKCYQIPHIYFLPGLMIKFSCCEDKLVPHFDLEERIKVDYILKCSKSTCSKNNKNFHLISGKLICEECLNILNINKKKINNDIHADLIAITCKIHYKKYIYYKKFKNYLLYCNECDSLNGSILLRAFYKELKIENFDINEKLINIYLLPLFKNLKKTYEIYQKTIPNAYLNFINFKEYFDNYDIISPFCPECKKIYNINNNNYSKDNKNNNSSLMSENISTNNLEVKCRCGPKDYNSINQFEEKLNSITCCNCNEIFEQNKMFYDIISEEIICEECLKSRRTIDYIRFNEICYICCLHRFNFEFYCEKCYHLFCRNCINLNNHQYKNLKDLSLNQENRKILEYLENKKWFIKFKKSGYLNITYSDINCTKFNNNEKNNQFKKLATIFGGKKDSFDINIIKKENSIKSIINRIENSMLYYKLFGTNLEIVNLKDKINQMELSIIALLKELNNKNKLVQLLKIRNNFQHLIFNIIKQNYNSFKKIEPNFRILYESYKYLKYEQKYKDKENEIIKK